MLPKVLVSGVNVGDQIREILDHNLAAHLECRRKFAGLLGELVGEHSPFPNRLFESRRLNILATGRDENLPFCVP